jgi:hypothetical protein
MAGCMNYKTFLGIKHIEVHKKVKDKESKKNYRGKEKNRKIKQMVRK